MCIAVNKALQNSNGAPFLPKLPVPLAEAAQLLTKHVEAVGFAPVPSSIGRQTRVPARVRELRLGDLQGLPAGHDPGIPSLGQSLPILQPRDLRQGVPLMESGKWQT